MQRFETLLSSAACLACLREGVALLAEGPESNACLHLSCSALQHEAAGQGSCVLVCSRVRTASAEPRAFVLMLEPCCLPVEGPRRQPVPQSGRKPGQLYVSLHTQVRALLCCAGLLGHFQIHMGVKSIPKLSSSGQSTAASVLQRQFLEKSEPSGKKSCWSGVQGYDSFSLSWRSFAQREKSVSVTGKHLLMRNKKQKPAEPVTEQAIRKAFYVKINPTLGNWPEENKIDMIFHSCLSMKVYHVPASEAPPWGSRSLTHRDFH